MNIMTLGLLVAITGCFDSGGKNKKGKNRGGDDTGGPGTSLSDCQDADVRLKASDAGSVMEFTFLQSYVPDSPERAGADVGFGFFTICNDSGYDLYITPKGALISSGVPDDVDCRIDDDDDPAYYYGAIESYYDIDDSVYITKDDLFELPYGRTVTGLASARGSSYGVKTADCEELGMSEPAAAQITAYFRVD